MTDSEAASALAQLATCNAARPQAKAQGTKRPLSELSFRPGPKLLAKFPHLAKAATSTTTPSSSSTSSHSPNNANAVDREPDAGVDQRERGDQDTDIAARVYNNYVPNSDLDNSFRGSAASSARGVDAIVPSVIQPIGDAIATFPASHPRGEDAALTAHVNCGEGTHQSVES